MLRLVLKLALVDLIQKLSMVVVFTLNSHMSQRKIKYAQPLLQRSVLNGAGTSSCPYPGLGLGCGGQRQGDCPRFWARQRLGTLGLRVGMRTTLTTSLLHPGPQTSLVRLGRGKRSYLRWRGHLTCHSRLRDRAIKDNPFTRKLELKGPNTPTSYSLPPPHKPESSLSVLWHRCSGHLLWVGPRPRALEKERVGCAGGLCC